MQKQLLLLECILNTASALVKISKQFPRRRFYIKKRNRRPMKKKKVALLKAQMAVTTVISAAQVYHIATAPTPKFPSGL